MDNFEIVCDNIMTTDVLEEHGRVCCRGKRFSLPLTRVERWHALAWVGMGQHGPAWYVLSDVWGGGDYLSEERVF